MKHYGKLPQDLTFEKNNTQTERLFKSFQAV